MSVPLIHQTDLFRPHMDPDDHWDLACVFALAAEGRFDVKGVLIDYPPRPDRQPDGEAIAQLNHLYGQSVPFVVGSSLPMARRDETQGDAPAHERNGVYFILRTLRESAEAVVIQIVGSCRDVALAANLEPELFREKCRAIYLNAGTGTRTPSASATLEYNVAVNAQSYAAIFDIPCPIYWEPCFGEVVGVSGTQEYGTLYEFQQKDFLPFLPRPLQNYFGFVLAKQESSAWLHALREADFSDVLAAKGENMREMWCTCGIFHIAGLTVTTAGRAVPTAEADGNAVFTFDPIRVACDERGITTWDDDAQASDRFIFHIRDKAAYPTAATKAMLSLLQLADERANIR